MRRTHRGRAGVRGAQPRLAASQHARIARVRRRLQRGLPRLPDRRRADRDAAAAQCDRLAVPHHRAGARRRLRVPRLRDPHAGRGPRLAARRRAGGSGRRSGLGAEPAGRHRAAVPPLPARAPAVAALAALRLADRRGHAGLRRRDGVQRRSALLLPRRRESAGARGYDGRRGRRGRRGDRADPRRRRLARGALPAFARAGAPAAQVAGLRRVAAVLLHAAPAVP